MKEIKAEKALSLTNIDLADYVINPYKGCLYGCLYCYAANNKNISKLNYEWGDFLFIKTNIVDLLKKELKSIKKPNRILLGSITEPFQEIEDKYHLSRDIVLELKKNNIPVIILSKSDRITDIIPYLDYSEYNEVFLTINSDNIKERFELRSKSQDERIKSLKILLENNINTTVYISPFIPGITNYPEIFEKLKNLNCKIYIESYSLLMGRYDILKKKLSSEEINYIDNIYKDKTSYEYYYNNLIKEIDTNYKNYFKSIKYRIYPYNEYYDRKVKYE